MACCAVEQERAAAAATFHNTAPVMGLWCHLSPLFFGRVEERGSGQGQTARMSKKFINQSPEKVQRHVMTAPGWLLATRVYVNTADNPAKGMKEGQGVKQELHLQRRMTFFVRNFQLFLYLVH